MPMPPHNPYIRWTCTGCGWFMVTKKRSDCINHQVARCLKCQGSHFTPSSGSALDTIAIELNHFINKYCYIS
ncbi:MAG: hypothetical protein RLY71_3539 [Pseudomonadota bacterium]